MSVVLDTPSPCSAEVAELGEGTRWDGARRELIWVDILGGVLRTAAPREDGTLQTTAEHRLDVPVGAAAPLADDGGWVLAAGDGVALLSRAGTLQWLARPESGAHGSTRMNDACCDPAGRFWAGSMAYDATPEAGSLYRLDADGSLQRVLAGVTISNGLGWSPDGRTMYYADTGAGALDAFDYDPATGAISGRRTLVLAGPGEAAVDGLTIDDEGFIWAAMWGAGAVHRYSPAGELADVVRIPVSQVSCCCFGGPERSTLYISTAWTGLPPAQRAREPDAGRLFAVETAVSGPAAAPFSWRSG
jgi:sugar lactone lactonase YvrE